MLEESDTEPTKILGAALAPDRALNSSINIRLTEAPTIKHRLVRWLCIVLDITNARARKDY